MLKGSQRKHLRGLAHKLNPHAYIGKEGLSEEVLKSIKDNLERNELIKIKLVQGCPYDRKEIGQIIEQKTGCEVAGLIGKTIIAYKCNEEDPKIKLY